MHDWRKLVKDVRDGSKELTWARGVQLNRSATVLPDTIESDEVILKVLTPGKTIANTVTYFMDDTDWHCDCTPRDVSCEHLIVGALALRDGLLENVEDDDSRRASTVGYRFRRVRAGLSFHRVIRMGRDEIPLHQTVTAAARDVQDGYRLLVLSEDLAVDQVLVARTAEAVSSGKVRPLLKALARCTDVQIDGKSVKADFSPVGAVARVDEVEDGYQITLLQDPGITEVFGNGMALKGKNLHPVAELGMSRREVEDLRKGRLFFGDDVATLVTEVLPYLKSRVRMDIRADLPGLEVEEARIEITAEMRDGQLSILPVLVYGDPPIARLNGSVLKVLGDRIPQRDYDREKELSRSLKATLGLEVGRRETFEGEHAVAFSQKVSAWDGGSVLGIALENFFLASPLRPQVGILEGDLRIGFVSDLVNGGPSRGGNAKPEAVVRAWRAGRNLVPLIDGGYAPLPADWMERYGPLLGEFLAAREVTEKVPVSLVPELDELCREHEVAPPKAWDGMRKLLEADLSGNAPPLPEDLTASLREYQAEGISWLVRLRDAGMGALLADDMGLGKTLQALCIVEDKAIVICPRSVLESWKKEAEKFRPSLSVQIFHGPKRVLDESANLVVTTYAIMRQDEKLLLGREWKIVILDEAQAIKNPSSKTARVAHRLQANFRLALTGTPVENRLEELWSQMHFALPGLLGSRSGFAETYGQPIEGGDDEAAKRMRRRIRPFLLRRKKEEVAKELPPRTHVVLKAELSKEERELYDGILLATRRDVMAQLEAGGSVLAALEALLRLRQACCHRGLLPGHEADSSAKVDLLLEKLRTCVEEGHKALVFSQWTSFLDRIEPHLNASNLEFLRLDGSTRNRGELIETFQEKDGPPVLLLSLKAGGSGLTLTEADHVFMMDPWWNPAVEDQAADRAHRIGQSRPVFVHRLITVNSVEERILALQEKKRALAEAALTGTGAAAGLSRDEILDLIRG